jgi:hypothetical protein
MDNPTRRGRYRRRWTAAGLLAGVPAIAVPCLLFAQQDSQAATIDGNAYYQLVSVRSGKVLDVNGFSTADGARVQQWTDQHTANQQWKLRPTGTGYYELVNRNSGKVLGIAGSSTVNAAAAEQQTDSSSTAQEWKISEVSGSGAVTFTSHQSGQLLDVFGNSTAEGAAVIQFPATGGANQQWKLVKSDQPETPGSGPYAWKNAQVVGGGYVTGLVFNPREKGLLYARTDMGGAYRWDTAAEQWIPLTDWAGEKDWNLLGIDSLATDPVDPDRLYLGAGTYTNDWAGNGAILRSTDRGRSFQRTGLPFKLGANEPGRGAGERLVIDPATHGTLLLGTRKNGLWRSTDYGVIWNQVSSFPVKDGASSGTGISFVTYGSLPHHRRWYDLEDAGRQVGARRLWRSVHRYRHRALDDRAGHRSCRLRGRAVRHRQRYLAQQGRERLRQRRYQPLDRRRPGAGRDLAGGRDRPSRRRHRHHLHGRPRWLPPRLPDRGACRTAEEPADEQQHRHRFRPVGARGDGPRPAPSTHSRAARSTPAPTAARPSPPAQATCLPAGSPPFPASQETCGSPAVAAACCTPPTEAAASPRSPRCGPPPPSASARPRRARRTRLFT